METEVKQPKNQFTVVLTFDEETEGLFHVDVKSTGTEEMDIDDVYPMLENVVKKRKEQEEAARMRDISIHTIAEYFQKMLEEQQKIKEAQSEIPTVKGPDEI